jgi:hypothetical protein
MTLFNRISSLVKNLFRKNRVERDLDEEVLAHLEMLVDEKIAAGLNPVQARRAALIELGGLEQVKEKVRDVRAGMFLERLAQDLCYGSRMLRKETSPRFVVTPDVLSCSVSAQIETNEYQARRRNAMEKCADGAVLLHAVSGFKHWDEFGLHH